MEKRYVGLPPNKRFRLMHQLNSPSPSPSDNNPSCLPAKKRKECRLHYDSAPAPPSSLCLPAKKRIWALPPLDLNLDEQVQISGEEDDDDGIVCAVCNSTDGDPTDPIVLCDGCDLMVHAKCYGNPLNKANGIPEGEWYCAQCLDESGSEKSCCLCPVGGGALKATSDGRWAHLVCAIYVPEVYFEDPEGREGIRCERVLKKRWEKRCCLCKSNKNKNKGCVIDCSEPKCGLGFHVSCGFKEELCIEYKQGQGQGSKRGGVVAAFCGPHTHLWNKVNFLFLVFGNTTNTYTPTTLCFNTV